MHVASRFPGDVSRFTVGEQSGMIRMIVSPTVMWDFETPPNSYSLTVRATDNPGGTPRLSVSYNSNVCPCIVPILTSGKERERESLERGHS